MKTACLFAVLSVLASGHVAKADDLGIIQVNDNGPM